jgi:N-acetyl-gamma-glutamyl-phosphate reductase
LVRGGLLPADWPITVNAVSGYSGGGRPMIAEFEDKTAADYTQVPYRLYATGLEHKHVPEMQARIGLTRRPLFTPAVGRYAQGMIVEVPLPLGALPGRPTARDVQEALATAYAGERFVEVASTGEAATIKTLGPEGRTGPTGCASMSSPPKRMARPGWWRCWTISARARRGRRCRI